MMPSSPLPLLLLVLATLCSCKTVRILVQPSASLANPATLSEVTAATLVTSGRTYRTLLQTDNAFVFRNVTEGSYLLEVLAPSHLFAPLRVDVDHTGAVAGAWVTFRGNTWENRGPALPVLVDEHAYTIETRAAMEKTYFVLREGFQPLKMLGSPMILIAIFSLVMVYFLPRMMEKMDPDTKQELEARTKKAPSAQSINPMSDFDLAGFLAGASSSATKSASPATKSGGNAKKR